MSNQEFDLGFDLLWNNIMSNTAPGLNSYEKSMFLTKAQDELLKNYFNPKGNKYLEGIDDSRKRELDFSVLVSVYEENNSIPDIGYSNNGFSFSLPNDIFFLLNESCEVVDNNEKTINLTVMPISAPEYTRLMNKPFKAPYKWQCWRLFTQSEEGSNVELIPGYGIKSCKYRIRYIRYPSPIILQDLPEPLEIGGIRVETSCELNKEIHQDILQRAVELAKMAYIGNDTAILEMGKRSE